MEKDSEQKRKKVWEFKPKVCPICGKTFMPKAWAQKYCSLDCGREAEREQSRKRNRGKIFDKGNRNCLICGKEFTPNSNSQVYCCAECAYKAKLERMRTYNTKVREKKRAERVTLKRICAICGKEFIPAANNQKYCSADCADVAMRQRKHEEGLRLTEQKRARKKGRHTSQIDSKLAAARAAGLSYGEYVARELKEQVKVDVEGWQNAR